METARAAKTGMDKVNEEFEYLQKRLMKHLNIRFFLACLSGKQRRRESSNLIQSELQSGGGNTIG